MPSPATTVIASPDRWDWALPHLNDLLARRRPRRVLLLSPAPAPPLPDRGDGMHLVRLCVSNAGAESDLRGRLDELPFVGRAFDMVLVFDLVTDGAGAEFAELLRVLDAGGQLVVLGPGRCCAPTRRAGALPLRAGSLCQTLRSRRFVIEQRLGHGLAGRPVDTGTGWLRPLFALSDSQLVSARHQGHDPVVRPLRFARPRALGGRSAVLDGLNREAAA